ncbi:putative 28S ribosomal protein S10 [Dirofilaria immitis]|nr:putative 28S ribosomal protein S10, mitochondrial [Dirofilaria immitis]
MFGRVPTVFRNFFGVHYSSVGITSVRSCSRVGRPLTPSFEQDSTVEFDRLFTRIQLEYRGHDKAVLKSYTTFLKAVCNHLKLEIVSVKVFPYVWWIQNALRAKFAKKKNQLHYETRTHIRQFTIGHVTGSTASTFLEYIQRNIPEGVAMKVTYDEIAMLPEIIRSRIKSMQLNDLPTATLTMSQEEKIIVETLLSEGKKHSVNKESTSVEN